MCALRRIGLAHTQFATATCGTIRLKLLKIGALVRISVRRVVIAMASASSHLLQHLDDLGGLLLIQGRDLQGQLLTVAGEFIVVTLGDPAYGGCHCTPVQAPLMDRR